MRTALVAGLVVAGGVLLLSVMASPAIERDLFIYSREHTDFASELRRTVRRAALVIKSLDHPEASRAYLKLVGIADRFPTVTREEALQAEAILAYFPLTAYSRANLDAMRKVVIDAVALAEAHGFRKLESELRLTVEKIERQLQS